jgi:SecD/SecF fusion protein
MQVQADQAQDAQAPAAAETAPAAATQAPATAPAPAAPAVETPAPAAPAVEATAPAPPAAAEAPVAPVVEALAPATPAAPVTPAVETPLSVPASADIQEAVDKAVATIGTSPADTTDSVPVAATGISSEWVFLLGLGLLTIFIVYLAAESTRRKRIFGSVLSVAVAAISVWLFSTLGMEKGIELQGGVSMEIKIRPGEGREITKDTQDQAISVLASRFNALGTGEVFLAPSGPDGIFLQMPGVGQEELERIQETLEKVAQLEFSILHPQSDFLASQVASGGQVIPGYEALPYKEELDDNGEKLPVRYGLVKIKRDMSGKNVASANYFYGDKGDSISVDFTGEGAKIMGPLTNANQGQPLAIILDDVILSSPVIQEPFSTGCSITGNFTQAEALALASSLENPLQNPIEIEFSNYISPTMGEVSVRQGVVSGIAGLCLTLIFILFYYRFAGVIALIGLSTCILIIFGTMALFQFTLTLPGIAGIILSIGMAVDANVLIYERLREELAEGKSLRASIETAYDKAFSSIMDSNLTTLFTAIILYVVADGTVKGFAVTVVIGIFATLFGALVVTRVCFTWMMDAKSFKKLTFMNFAPKRIFDFLSHARPWLIFSAVSVIISMIAIPAIDPRGVELKGGDSITIRSTEGLTKEGIIASITKLDLGAAPIVQEQQPVGDDGTFFLVRTPDNTADKVLEHLEEDMKVTLEDTTVSSVGSAVGKSMLFSSMLAMGLGVLAILAYVTLRYELSFAVGVIAALIHDVVVALGVATLMGQELSLIVVGALLTIAGYSVNDTIVVFDRVREGLATKRGEVKDIMNYALNKTLSRTILTSSTTLFTVLVLLIFGGPGLRSFAVVLTIGLIAGTYSTLFIAAPIVLWWAKRTGTNLRREVLDTEQSKIEAAAGPAAQQI